MLEKLFEKLLKFCVKNNASDVHFILQNNQMKMSVRGALGIIEIKEKYDIALFHYLKFISNLDLGNVSVPQSGNFHYCYRGKELFFRFSFIQTIQIQSAVLRILNNHVPLDLKELSKERTHYEIFKKWTRFRSGLIIVSGPTGSGKTTTLNALLENVSQNKKLKVITLEDPVEIPTQSFLQLQVNERMNFDYEEGIKQLLRHDPDVIMIGEIRDSKTAKTLIRCALSGHMVFTTLHAKSCSEAILRLIDFGVSESDLKQVLSAITNQRIFPEKQKKGKVCIYEVMEKDDLGYFFKNKENARDYHDIFKQIEKAVSKGWISKSYAQQDIEI